VGDCKFERKGGRLTIKVPGRRHELSFWQDRLNAPRLLRQVEGDFVIQVRVGGLFRPTGQRLGNGHRAGIVLLFGKNAATLLRGTNSIDGKLRDYLEGGFFKPEATREDSFHDPVTPLGTTVFLRLERLGHLILLKTSQDGKTWKTKLNSFWMFFHLPDKLKVGVVAESTAEGVLQAEFDHFELTPLLGRGLDDPCR
jgi:hypothetical protein